jgi:large subunit ribosomal protein L25
MKEIELKVQKRDTGKAALSEYRSKGMVPGIYYSKGEDNINILSHPLDLRDIVYTRMTKVFSLEIEGDPEKKRCILKDADFDPVTESMVHFDLLGIKDGQKLTLDIPFKLEGQSVGVRNGGRMQQNLLKAKITCLPEDLVESISVDVSKLKIGQSISITDLDLTEKFEFDISRDTVICHVARPRLGGADEDEDEEETTAEGATEETSEEAAEE